MSRNYIVLPIETECIQFNQERYTFCMPRVVNCFPQNEDGILSLPGEEWNCNLPCPADDVYFVPYVIGDTIDIQTRFHNSDREPGSFYLDVELLDSEGDVVSDTLAEFLSDWMVGFDNKDLPFQTVRIDTSLDAFTDLSCFQLRFTYGDIIYTTQWYAPVPACKAIVTIQSNPRRDCLGNYYGASEIWAGSNPILFNNQMRYYADLKFGGVVGNDDEQLEFQTLVTNKLLPPFMVRILANVHLGHKKVFINGKEYDIEGFPRNAVRPNSNMSHITVDVQKRCRREC